MKIGLFIPCYVDALYPEVGVATYKLLTSLGCGISAQSDLLRTANGKCRI